MENSSFEHTRRIEGEIDSQITRYTTHGKSLSRHLEMWGKRFVRCANGLISLGANPNNLKTYCIIPGSVTRNYYASPKRRHSVSICCVHGESSQEMEIKFSFKSKAEESVWLEVFESQLRDLSQHQQCVLLNTIKSISLFLHDRYEQSSDSQGVISGSITGDESDPFEIVEDPCLSLIRSLNKHVLDDIKASGRSHELETVRGHASRSQVALRSRMRPYWSIPVPKLRVVIMTVGTRGDVQPFILLGKRLQQDGHRVRLATHEIFRDYVSVENDLEFYPLGGDPQLLSQFMVKTKGFLIPMSMETIQQVPKNVAMINEIIHSCWGACIYPDPKDERKRSFIADAIISNPVTYGHIHCAEALGVPLHLMFPQPWVPTKAFPHPLSGLSYSNTEWSSANYLSYQTVDGVMWQSFLPYINNFRVNTLKLEPISFLERTWDLLNYHKVPFVKMWSRHLAPKPKDWPNHIEIVGAFVNTLDQEKSNEKEPTAKGIKLTDRIEENPPSLKRDLKSDVYGSGSRGPKVESALDTFLGMPNVLPPIFVGFGSMVVDNPEQLIKTMLEGAAIADVRILVQSGWSAIDQDWFIKTAKEIERQYNPAAAEPSAELCSSIVSDSGPPVEQAPAQTTGNTILGAISQQLASTSDVRNSGVHRKDKQSRIEESKAETTDLPGAVVSSRPTRWRASDALLIGNYPHDLLFPRVCAVVHHGGAGTTAGGLIAGKPTLICPFFGDQPFWGEMVYKAGLGPSPCPINQLTPTLVAEKFIKLLSPDMQSKARKISVDMKAEGDGVTLGMQAFYRHLPIEDMICDVSLMRHEVRLAQVYCRTCRLKMAREVSDLIHEKLREEVNKSNSPAAHDIVPCIYKDWSLPAPTGVVEGVLQGAGALAHETFGAIADAFTEPVRGIYYRGLQGGLQGVVAGMKSLAVRPVEGTKIMYNKVSEGFRGSGYGSYKPQTGGYDPRVQKDGDIEDEQTTPEQAARWYGDASMIMMASSAQARADRSFLLSEEDNLGGKKMNTIAGAKSVVHRYGTMAIMESTIIEELENTESIANSVEDDEEAEVGNWAKLAAKEGSGSVAFPERIPVSSVLISEGITAPLNMKDSTILRTKDINASVILRADAVKIIDQSLYLDESTGGHFDRDSDIDRFGRGSFRSDAESILDDESEVSSVVVSSVEDEQICDIVEEVGLVRSGPDREVLSNVKAQVVLPEHSVVNESRWCVSDSTDRVLQSRSLMKCYLMVTQLQKIFQTIMGIDNFSERPPTTRELQMLITSAMSKTHIEAYMSNHAVSSMYGRLLSGADLLGEALQRWRKHIDFTDLCMLYIQEELPLSNAIAAKPDLAGDEIGLNSIYWLHESEGTYDVWLDGAIGR